VLSLESDVDSVELFSTHSENRRRFDGVVIYFFFDSDFKCFDDASEFSFTSLYVVFFYFHSSCQFFFKSGFSNDYIIRSSTVLLL